MKNVCLFYITVVSIALSSCGTGGKNESATGNAVSTGEYAAGVNEILSNEALDEAANQAMSSSNTH